MAKREVIIEVQVNNDDGLRQLGKLEKELIQVRKRQRELRKDTKDATEVTAEEAREMGLLASKAKALSGNIRELSNDTSGLTKAGLRFRDKMAQAGGEALQAFGLNVLTVSGAVATLTAALKGAIEIQAEFDKSLSGISALGGEYAANIEALADAAKTAGIEFGISATESVKAVDALARAGLTSAQIIDGGLRGALTLAAAGGIDLANAAETASSALTQFGLEGEDVGRVADALVGGANAAQGGVDELRQALNQSGLVAAQFGLSLEETVGALTTFASAGLLGSDAGTSFRAMLLRLAKPTKESSEAMEQYGLELFDAQGQFVGVEKAADQLQKGLGQLTEEQRLNALATIFGQDAIRAANVLYEQGAEGVAKFTAEVSKSGEAERVAAEQTNNLDGDLNRLKATYTALIVESRAMNDILRESVQYLDEFIKTASGATDATNSLARRQALAFETWTFGAVNADTFQDALSSLTFGYYENSEASKAASKEAEANAQTTVDAVAVTAGAIKQTSEFGTVIEDTAKKEEKQTTVRRKAIEVLRLQTQAMRDFAAAQRDAESGAAVDTLSPISPQATPLQPVADRLLGDTVDAFDQSAQAAENESDIFVAAQEAKIQAVNSLGNALNAFSSIAAKDSAEQKALATASALINTYLGVTQVLANKTVLPEPFATVNKIASIATVLATGLGAVRNIQGFDEGGIVGVHRDGQPIRRSNGDNRLVTAKVGEMFLNERQQREIRRQAGYDIFRAAGVPGSNNTGSFALGGPVRGTALVNMPTAPTPTPTFAELDSIRASVTSQAKDPNIFVRVTDIDKAQGRRASVLERATL